VAQRKKERDQEVRLNEKLLLKLTKTNESEITELNSIKLKVENARSSIDVLAKKAKEIKTLIGNKNIAKRHKNDKLLSIKSNIMSYKMKLGSMDETIAQTCLEGNAKLELLQTKIEK